MKYQTRLQILEEIATKVAELPTGSNKLPADIITKAFSLQTKKKRNMIIEQNAKRPVRIKAVEMPTTPADLTKEFIEKTIEEFKANS